MDNEVAGEFIEDNIGMVIKDMVVEEIIFDEFAAELIDNELVEEIFDKDISNSVFQDEIRIPNNTCVDYVWDA